MLLDWWGGGVNRYKHGNNFHKQWTHFYPFVTSIDIIRVIEALVVLVSLSQLMAAKMEEHILYMCGWVNGQILIVVTRLYSCMIHVDHLPSPLQDRDTD